MATLVIDRATLPDSVSDLFGVPRIAVVQQRGGDVLLSPVIDPADYDNDTDYLNAIPGMADSIIKSMNAPMSEFEDIPRNRSGRNSNV
jgi:hypothetical protein